MSCQYSSAMDKKNKMNDQFNDLLCRIHIFVSVINGINRINASTNFFTNNSSYKVLTTKPDATFDVFICYGIQTKAWRFRKEIFSYQMDQHLPRPVTYYISNIQSITLPDRRQSPTRSCSCRTFDVN